MPAFQLKNRQGILRELIAAVVSRTTLTDVTDSSALRHILGAISIELEDIYYQLVQLQTLFSIDDAVASDLDDRAKEVLPPISNRRAPRPARGQIVFYASAPVLTSIFIPAGTSVRGREGFSARTTASTFISSGNPAVISGHSVGQDSIPVGAEAIVGGEQGNIGVGVVNGIGSSIPGVISATNLTSFFGGVSVESDEELRGRIKRLISNLARATPWALQELTIDLVDPSTLKRVVFSKTYENTFDRGNVILYIDDGAGTAAERVSYTNQPVPGNPIFGGETFLKLPDGPVDDDQPFVFSKNTVALTQGVDYYLNPSQAFVELAVPAVVTDVFDATYTVFTGLIAYITTVVNGTDDRLTYPGIRPAGTLVRVRAPYVDQIQVEGVITPMPNQDQQTVLSNAASAVLAYVNSLGIGVDVIRSEIIQRIMDVPGVYDVNLVQPVSNIFEPEYQVARVTVANITLT